MRPYWSAFASTEEFIISYREINSAETEEAKKSALEKMLERYTNFLERVMEDDGK